MTLGMSASAYQFEQLVRNILEANQFQVQEGLLGNRDVGFDFLAD